MRTKIGLALVALLVIGIVATAVSQPMKGRGKMPCTVLPGDGSVENPAPQGAGVPLAEGTGDPDA